MTSQTTVSRQSSTDPHRELLALVDAHVRAVRAKDLEALLSTYAPDVRTFDMVEPLENRGIAALRARLEQWFGSFATPIDYSLSDIELTVSGEVAFDHHLVHVAGTNVKGERVDMWFRETVGWKKTGGTWKVTHQHSSVPFDMTSGRARLDLTPGAQRGDVDSRA